MLGYTKAYDFSQALTVEQLVKIDFSVYPKTVSNVLNIVLDDKLLLEKVFVHDITGKVLRKTEQY